MDLTNGFSNDALSGRGVDHPYGVVAAPTTKVDSAAGNIVGTSLALLGGAVAIKSVYEAFKIDAGTEEEAKKKRKRRQKEKKEARKLEMIILAGLVNGPTSDSSEEEPSAKKAAAEAAQRAEEVEALTTSLVNALKPMFDSMASTGEKSSEVDSSHVDSLENAIRGLISQQKKQVVALNAVVATLNTFEPA